MTPINDMTDSYVPWVIKKVSYWWPKNCSSLPVNSSCHTCECDRKFAMTLMYEMTHSYVTGVMHEVSYALPQDGNGLTYEWVMSHMHELCHVWMSHVTYEWVTSHFVHKCEITLPQDSSGLTVNESCHICMSHVTYEWVMSYMIASRHISLISSKLHCPKIVAA